MQRKCIDRNISLAGIQVLFEEADTHGSGYLDYLEFRRFCEDLGLDHSPSEASEAGLTHTGPDRVERAQPRRRVCDLASGDGKIHS